MQHILSNGKEIGSEYLYDVRGNISTYYIVDVRTDNMLYGYNFFYNQTGNKNKLVKVKSLTTNEEYNIDYSVNGEPSLYLGWTISYDMKNITTLLNSNYEINYTYNASGIRTSKVVTKNNSTTTTQYILDGTNIIKEIRSGENNITLKYFYDSNNEIVGFTYNDIKYLYLKNLQNDIIGIVDSNNNIVVKYYYNAYGRIINKVDTSGINLSDINPFRYRGYYQDDETGWYYLNSRYYDVETLRFITMDDACYLGASGSVLSYNLFSYCENNPVIRTDYLGNSSVVGFGIQLYVNVSWFGCGLEIVWFPSTQVSTGGNSRRMPYIYFFSEAGMGGSSGKINELLKEILKKPDKLFNSKTFLRNLNFSICFFIIIGNDSFSTPADYAGVFKSFSVTVRHIKWYLATSSTCVSIGEGWHSRRYAVSAAVSYYWLINSSYSTLGSIMNRVRFNSNKYV